MQGAEKKRRTFTDLIQEGFATEDDLVMLRNILIDKDIAIIGDKYTGLPLFIAIICDVYRDEMEKSPYVIYTTDYDYNYKLSQAKSKSFYRVIFQQVGRESDLDGVFEVQKYNPVIACIDPQMKLTKEDIENFDYIIDMSFGTSAKVKGIHKSEDYCKRFKGAE